MIDRRYLNWKNKLGYGADDVAGNVVYAFLSTFLMFYLTDTVGLNVGAVGILIAVSRILDAATDLIFGNLLDRTDTKLGKARPWMLYGYLWLPIILNFCIMLLLSKLDIEKANEKVLARHFEEYLNTQPHQQIF